MFRVTRIAVAAVLVMAVAALPVMLDRCVESCDAHQTATATPPCHHTTSTGTHVSNVPSSCGHDHNGSAVTAAKRFAPTGRAFASIVSASSHVPVAPPAAANVRFEPHAPPDPSSALTGRSLPLRV